MTTKMEYSPKEEQLLKVLRNRKSPVDTKELARQVYGDEVPFHSGPAVIAAMRGLIRKVSFNREPFTIEKSARRGPHAMRFVLKKKGERANVD